MTESEKDWEKIRTQLKELEEMNSSNRKILNEIYEGIFCRGKEEKLKAVRSVLGSLLIHVSDERLCDVIKHQKPQIPDKFSDDDQALSYLCADLLAFCGEIVPQGEESYKKMYQERILYLQRINGS